MDWSDVVLLILIAVILLQYIRLARKNKRLRQMADEANRLRVDAEAAWQRNRQLKQEMTSNIAHELKTPVSSIRGYLEILLGDKPLDDTRRHHYLQRCYSQTLRLSDLIQDVSLINKLEESADLFPHQQTDITSILHETIDELHDRAVANRDTLICKLPPAMPMLGNPELLYGIFRNLIENAVSYAGTDISIVIETYKEAPDAYYIHFYDTGQGVPDEYLSRLFDRFVRIGEGRSRADGGTGLGLSIVKHAVIFHGGEIYARNRGGGAGSADGNSLSGLEFFFSLKKR